MPGKGVPNANPRTMPKLVMHDRCSTKCQGHLAGFPGHQNFQAGVSLAVGDGGKVSLAKPETC
jgi:hypothetical protein